MDLSIFEYRDYKRYFRDLLQKSPGLRQGGRLRLAEAADCKPGYITQVLNHDGNFSLEQAERLAQFIGLEANETAYLLLLVNHARAGTKSLEAHFRAQIEATQQSRVNLRDKAKPGEILSPVEQATYYSSWHYAVIHILCTIEALASREVMAARLGISVERVGEILGFLEDVGLIERHKGQVRATMKRVFLDKDSAFNFRHHANFRQLAMGSLERLEKNEFHYSGVHSLSKEDHAKIVELIRALIVNSRAIIKDSPAEELVALNIDFFRV